MMAWKVSKNWLLGTPLLLLLLGKSLRKDGLPVQKSASCHTKMYIISSSKTTFLCQMADAHTVGFCFTVDTPL
jgi:hypothetical protein